MGIGKELIQRLTNIARDEKLDSIEALLTPDNKSMLSLAERLGWSISPSPDGSMMSVKLLLKWQIQDLMNEVSAVFDWPRLFFMPVVK